MVTPGNYPGKCLKGNVVVVEGIEVIFEPLQGCHLSWATHASTLVWGDIGKVFQFLCTGQQVITKDLRLEQCLEIVRKWSVLLRCSRRLTGFTAGLSLAETLATSVVNMMEYLIVSTTRTGMHKDGLGNDVVNDKADCRGCGPI